MKNQIKVLGIDAGTTRVGFAILNYSNSKPHLIHYGLLPIKSNNHNTRIKQIYDQIKKIIKKYNPQVVVLERMYYYLNRKTAFEVSQAIGVINLACTQLKIPTFFVTPTQVKKNITNKGTANKKEIQTAIFNLFNINNQKNHKKKQIIDDITDAIAIALSYIKINNPN